jgi:hypothetical protein
MTWPDSLMSLLVRGRNSSIFCLSTSFSAMLLELLSALKARIGRSRIGGEKLSGNRVLR